MLNRILQVKACVNSSGECIDYYASAMFVSLNILSVMVNLIHIIVLVNMQSLKNRKCFWILLNLTLADTVGAIFIAISCSCAVYELLISAKNGIVFVLITIGQQSSLMCRYYQLTLACLDRYYAVCKPFDYNTSRLINNIGKLSALSWIIPTIIPIVKVSLTVDKACLGEFSTYEISISTPNGWFDIFTSCFIAVPSLVTAVLLIKVSRELKRMSARGNMTSEDREVKSATRYVIGTCVMFYCSVIPLVAGLCLHGIIGDPRNPIIRAFLIVVIICQTLYGVGNIILYGFLNPTYQQRIKDIFRRFCCQSKISPT